MKSTDHRSDQPSPELLWKQFTGGNMASFRLLYQMYYEPLYRYGLKYVSSDETEDVIQSLFLYVLQRKKSIAKVQHVKAYLFKSFHHELMKVLKSKNLVVEQVDVTVEEEIVSSKEPLFIELLALLKRLSPRELEVVNLKYYQDYNNLEIANSLGLKNQTIRNTLVNAIKKMKRNA
jgi:RNA polymerase sigma-70 factor (ECF subfamily)